MLAQLLHFLEGKTRVDAGDDVGTLREGAITAPADAFGRDAKDAIAGAVGVGWRDAAEELDEDGDGGISEDGGTGVTVPGAAAVNTQGGAEARGEEEGKSHNQ